ncbi:DUF1186 domain-containing protein [Methylosinus sp. LW3]|uniref:DUF1186 domain-containing protein n=1 Tax=Methylosinus sp. LW3 TaxID=107635 RepID=UPI00055A28BE
MTSPVMPPEEILRSLTRRYFYDGPVPEDAIEEACRRRDEMLPLFLVEIEKFLSASPRERLRKPTPVHLILFVLGEWGDQRAYRPLARLIRCPQFTEHHGFGTVFDDVGHRVIAAVYDGDPEPLFEAARDPKADRLARHYILCNALAMLVHHEKIDREVVANFLIDLYEELGDYPFVWYGWARLAARLGLSAFRPLVLQAIAEERFDDYEIDEFDKELKLAIARPGAEDIDEEFLPFEGAYEEIIAYFPP